MSVCVCMMHACMQACLYGRMDAGTHACMSVRLGARKQVDRYVHKSACNEVATQTSVGIRRGGPTSANSASEPKGKKWAVRVRLIRKLHSYNCRKCRLATFHPGFDCPVAHWIAGSDVEMGFDFRVLTALRLAPSPASPKHYQCDSS